MGKARVPDEKEVRILRENDMNPDRFQVTFREENMIVLRNHKTRDEITIHKGDRKW